MHGPCFEIVQTLGCVLEDPKAEGLDRIAGKIVTIVGQSENGTVMAAPMKQRE